MRRIPAPSSASENPSHPRCALTVSFSASAPLCWGLLAWALTSARLTWLQRVALAAIGAGGGSNLIDRLRFDGTVTDFLNLGWGSLRTGIFNLADAILMLGAVVLLISSRARP